MTSTTDDFSFIISHICHTNLVLLAGILKKIFNTTFMKIIKKVVKKIL